MMKKDKDCGCGKITWTGRCRSCANKERAVAPRKKGIVRDKWSDAARERRRGAGNPNWKGDKVGLLQLHDWVRTYKEKTACEVCGNPDVDLANVSGEYKRDILDFRWLCRKCHMISDGRLEKFREMGQNRKGTHLPGYIPSIIPRDPLGRRQWSNNTSGYRGVSWDKHNKKWAVHRQVKGAYKFCGRFDDLEEAGEAYDRATTL